MERILLFEILDADKRYMIYSDGYLIGFSESAKVINYATHIMTKIAHERFIAGKLAGTQSECKCRTDSSVP